MSRVPYVLISYCLTQSDMLAHLFINMHGWNIIYYHWPIWIDPSNAASF